MSDDYPLPEWSFNSKDARKLLKRVKQNEEIERLEEKRKEKRSNNLADMEGEE